MSAKTYSRIGVVLWDRFERWLFPTDVLGDIRYEAWDKECNPLERERRVPDSAENASRKRLSLSKASMGR